MKCVEVGSQIIMHVKIMLKDKSVAQDTKQDDMPVKMSVGDGSFTSGFEEHLLGLKIGEKNTFMVKSEDGFGESNPVNIHKIPRSRFSQEAKLECGLIFIFTQPDGQELPGVIRKIQEDQVTVDFNHPLCGQDLIFEVEILDIEQPVKH